MDEIISNMVGIARDNSKYGHVAMLIPKSVKLKSYLIWCG